MSNIYLGTIDAGGDGKTLLLAAINRATNSNYQMVDFGFGVPEPVTNVPAPSHNTMVTFGPTLASGYYGVRRVFYNRIHASELGNIVVEYTGEQTLHEILPKINTKYGVLITPEDVVDVQINAIVGQQVAIDLEFRPESIIFYSSTQIQIGTNDPVGDTAPDVPYVPATTLLFNGSVDNDALTHKRLTPFSLSVSTDVVRVHGASLEAGIRNVDEVGYLSRLRVPNAHFASVARTMTGTGFWVDTINNRHRLIRYDGSIYELGDDGDTWQYIGNPFGLDPTNPDHNASAMARTLVKVAVQAPNGDVYAIARTMTSAPGVYKMEAGTNVWTLMTVSTTRIKLMIPAEWDTVQAMDAIASNGRLWVAVKAATTYDAHPTKTSNTPSVEVFNIDQGTSEYYPIGQTATMFTGVTGELLKLRFSTAPDDATHMDLVGIMRSSKNSNIHVVQYRYNTTGEYEAFLVPFAYISNDDSVVKRLDIAGTQRRLQQIPARQGSTSITNHYLDVITLIRPIPTDAPTGLFDESEVRTEDGFFTYGVESATCVSTRGHRTPWKTSSFALAKSFRPTFHFGCGYGRSIGIFQNGNGYMRLNASQDAGAATFSVLPASLSEIGKHTSFTDIYAYGPSLRLPLGVGERTDVEAVLTAIQDTEASNPAIAKSFIAKAADGTPVWVTADGATDDLTRRTVTPLYHHLGQVPAAVFAEDNRLIAISRDGFGAYISTTNGASWREFNAVPYMYQHERGYSPQLPYAGRAQLRLQPESIGEGTYAQNKLTFELRVDRTLNMFNYALRKHSEPTLIQDACLMFMGDATGNQKTYTGSAPEYTFGMNALSDISPRTLNAWDNDASNNIESLGLYTTDVTEPLGAKHRLDHYMFQVSGTLIDFSRDVKYLGVSHWLLVEDNGVWKLHFTDTIIPNRTIDLFGGGGAFDAFKPEVNFHLWDYRDDGVSYVPYVFVGGKRVLLLERMNDQNTFDVTQHNLTIPGDNGQPLTPVKMYTANRRDYYFAQRGNGIFKLAYNWNISTEVSSITLERVHALTGTALSDLTIISGCITGPIAANAPMESVLPDAIPAGTFIGEECRGYTKYMRYADGQGGYYEDATPESLECGYVAVDPTMHIVGS